MRSGEHVCCEVRTVMRGGGEVKQSEVTQLDMTRRWGALHNVRPGL